MPSAHYDLQAAPDKRTNNIVPSVEIPQKNRCFLIDMRVATFGISILALVDGLHSRYIQSIVTTLERRFDFTSAETGLIMACGDFTMLASIIIVTYLGCVINKARALAGCAILFVIGSLLWSLPYFVFSSKSSQATTAIVNSSAMQSEVDFMLCIANQTGSACGEEDIQQENANNVALVLFCVAEIVFGLAIFLPYSLGMAYIEENEVTHRASLFVGLMMGTYYLSGPFSYLMASAILAVPENLQENGLTQDDPRWVGAWWLGWLIMALIAAPWAVILMFFPAKFDKDGMSKAENKLNENDIVKSIETKTEKRSIVKIIAGLFVVIWSFLTNVVYMVVLCAIILSSFLGSGRGFDLKYMQSMFNINSSQVTLLSVIGSVASVIGSYASGILLSRLKVRLTGTMLVLVMVYIVSGVLGLVEAFIYCPAPVFHDSVINNKLILQASCNMNCSCSDTSYEPVCSKEVNFINTCYAGCSNVSQVSNTYNFTDCSCIPNGFATKGICVQKCDMLWPYIILNVLTGFVKSIGETPMMLMIIRTIPKEEYKALAFAFATTLYALLASIPGPIVYGILIDWTCLWRESSCGFSGACQVYNLDYFRYILKLPAPAGTIIAGAIYFCAYKLAIKRGLGDQKMTDKDEKQDLKLSEVNLESPKKET